MFFLCIFLYCCYFFLLYFCPINIFVLLVIVRFLFYLNLRHLNDIHVYSNTIELEVGQLLKCEYVLIKLKWRLGCMGHQYSSLVLLCTFIFGGPTKPHTFLWMAVQLTFGL